MDTKGEFFCISGPDKGKQVNWVPADPNEELQIEIYSPPYMFKGQRPVIDSAPNHCSYGEEFTINSAASGVIKWASLIRNGVTTHSYNTTQRLVDLEIKARTAGSIEVAVPSEPNIAPQGYYMLFIVDDVGVPSVAHWILLG